ncbi:Transcriptional activator [Ascosphaera atra]|nr:Transcriptional activator [Ascosphaera atra]
MEAGGVQDGSFFGNSDLNINAPTDGSVNPGPGVMPIYGMPGGHPQAPAHGHSQSHGHEHSHGPQGPSHAHSHSASSLPGSMPTTQQMPAASLNRSLSNGSPPQVQAQSFGGLPLAGGLPPATTNMVGSQQAQQQVQQLPGATMPQGPSSILAPSTMAPQLSHGNAGTLPPPQVQVTMPNIPPSLPQAPPTMVTAGGLAPQTMATAGLAGPGGLPPAPNFQKGEEHPLFVNAKQFHRILKRRYARQALERQFRDVAGGDAVTRAGRRPYLHESRHKHAMRRPRGPGGRFLTAEEVAAQKKKEEEAQLKNQTSTDNPAQLPEGGQTEANGGNDGGNNGNVGTEGNDQLKRTVTEAGLNEDDEEAKRARAERN